MEIMVGERGVESFENKHEVIRAEPQKEPTEKATLIEPQPVGDKNNGRPYPGFPLPQEFNICSRCECVGGGAVSSQQSAEQLLSSLAGT